MNRLVIIPDETHEVIGAELRPRLSAIAKEIRAGNIAQTIGPQALGMLASFAGGDSLLWARQGAGYQVAWENVAREVPLTNRAEADAAEGLIARVFESGRSETATSNELELSEWSNLQQFLTNPIAEISASPVTVFGTRVAVFTRMRCEPGDAPLPPPSELASLVSLLIGDRLVRMSLGLDSA